LWLGSKRGLETRIVPQAGIPLLTIAISGLRGHGLLTMLGAPFKVLVALVQALFLVGRARPAAVVGMGGFASGPGGLAAWLLRVPLLLHEQNAILGFTNRMLAPLAARLMEAFPGTFARTGATHTGNPVRGEILAVAPPRERRRRDGRVHILVLGGSQGARVLNRTLPQGVRQLGGELPLVWHQSGEGKVDDTRSAYAQAGVQARVEPFVKRIHEAYAWADVVICRAGAMTIAELSAVGVASILVPYPYAVDDHQTANARYLTEAGAAVLIPETEFTAERLASVIRALLHDREKLLSMAEAARAVSKPHATEQVAQTCVEVAYA